MDTNYINTTSFAASGFGASGSSSNKESVNANNDSDVQFFSGTSVQSVSADQFKSYGAGLSKPETPRPPSTQYVAYDADKQPHYFQSKDDAQKWANDYGFEYGLVGGLEHPINHVLKLFGWAAGADSKIIGKLGQAGDAVDTATNFVPTMRAFNLAKTSLATAAKVAHGDAPTADDVMAATQNARGFSAPQTSLTMRSTPKQASKTNEIKTPDEMRSQRPQDKNVKTAADETPMARAASASETPQAKIAIGAPADQLSMPVKLTPANVGQVLPGLTQEGLKNAMGQINGGEKLPPISTKTSIDNATRYFNEGTRPGLNGGSPPTPFIRSASDPGNRSTLASRVGQSPYSSQPGSYSNVVGLVNEALHKGGFGLSNTSLDSIRKSMDSVDQQYLPHAQASFRESRGFARDASNSQLPTRDRAAAVGGAFLNAFLGPAFLAETDISNHLSNRSGSTSYNRAVMNGFMTHDPLYNS